MLAGRDPVIEDWVIETLYSAIHLTFKPRHARFSHNERESAIAAGYNGG